MKDIVTADPLLHSYFDEDIELRFEIGHTLSQSLKQGDIVP